MAQPAQYRGGEAGGSLDIRIRSLEGAQYPPGDLVISDPYAQMAGYDPRDDYTYQEIPGATYTQEGDAFRLYLLNAVSGNYSLRVIGADYGRYDVSMTGYDRTGARADIRFSALLEPGQVHHYLIRYSNSDGARISARRTPIGE